MTRRQHYISGGSGGSGGRNYEKVKDIIYGTIAAQFIEQFPDKVAILMQIRPDNRDNAASFMIAEINADPRIDGIDDNVFWSISPNIAEPREIATIESEIAGSNITDGTEIMDILQKHGLYGYPHENAVAIELYNKVYADINSLVLGRQRDFELEPDDIIPTKRSRKKYGGKRRTRRRRRQTRRR